jgi:hypothetical protein
MDFRYIADQINQQSGIPLGTGVRQRGMEGVSNEPFVWSSALQKFVPNPNQFDRLSPADQAQYLFSQTNQFGSSSSDAPVSQRITPNVPPDINAVNVQDVQQNNAPNVSDNVDYQPPPYVPLEIDTSDYLGQSLLGKLTNSRQKSQFENLLGTSQSQPNASRQNMAQDNSPSFMQNILGTVPSYYSGLLGAEEAKSLQSRANTQGLLGAAIGLLGGMGTRGTTAAQNIAGALGGGLQASQGAIQQGITNYGQQQQLMLQQRQQAGIAAMKIKYPDLADEFDTNPAGAFRIISEREAAANKPTVVSQGGTLVDRSGNVLFASSAADKAKGRILTPEEVKQYDLPATGKYQFNANGEISLISGTGPGKDGKVATSIEEFQFAQQQGYKGSYESFLKSKTPSTSTNVNVNANKAFGTEFGKGVAESVNNTYSAAQGAQSTLGAIQSIRPLIQAGVYAGPLSSVPRVVDQLATSLGVTGKDNSEKLKNTAVAMQGLASLELSAAQAMKGQGAITENERSLIKRAAGGDLQTFTQPEVLSLLNALEKTSQFKIKAHEKNLGRLRNRPDTAELADFYSLEQQAPPAPAAVRKFNPATGRLE